MADHRCS